MNVTKVKRKRAQTIGQDVKEIIEGKLEHMEDNFQWESTDEEDVITVLESMLPKILYLIEAKSTLRDKMKDDYVYEKYYNELHEIERTLDNVVRVTGNIPKKLNRRIKKVLVEFVGDLVDSPNIRELVKDEISTRTVNKMSTDDIVSGLESYLTGVSKV